MRTLDKIIRKAQVRFLKKDDGPADLSAYPDYDEHSVNRKRTVRWDVYAARRSSSRNSTQYDYLGAVFAAYHENAKAWAEADFGKDVTLMRATNAPHGDDVVRRLTVDVPVEGQRVREARAADFQLRTPPIPPLPPSRMPDPSYVSRIFGGFDEGSAVPSVSGPSQETVEQLQREYQAEQERIRVRFHNQPRDERRWR